MNNFRVKRNSKRRTSKSNVIKEQSESVVRGDHPLTFVLPTVSLSETDRSELSDLDGITSTEYSSSTSVTGVNEVRSSPNPQDRIRRIQRDRYTTLYNEERRSPRSKFRRHSRLPIYPHISVHTGAYSIIAETLNILAISIFAPKMG